MPRPRTSPIHWPQAIPRTRRQRVTTGCFSLHRQPLPEEFYDNHEVEISGNLLIVAVRGGLTLRRGEEVVVIRGGWACLVPAGSLGITEVPASACGGVDIQLIFFDDRVLRQRFEDIARVERLASVMPAPSIELCQLPDFLTELGVVTQIEGFDSPDAVKALNVAFNHGWSSAWSFLRGFFARRRQLHLFLEEHVLPVESPEEIESIYPGGRSGFRRDFRAQYDIPLSRWLKWRRLQVARIHLRHGPPVPIERIARGVGYSNTASFRHQFRARYGLWPEEVPDYNDCDSLPPARLAQALAPFWHWSHDEISASRDACGAILNRKMLPQWQQREFRQLYLDERRPRKRPPEHGFLTGEFEPVDTTPLDTGFEKFIEHEHILNPVAPHPMGKVA